MAIVDTSLDLPPGQPTKDIDCTLENDIKAWFSIPHMHHWGSNITVDHVRRRRGWRSGCSTPNGRPSTRSIRPRCASIRRRPNGFAKAITSRCAARGTTTPAARSASGRRCGVFFAQTVDDVNLGNLACDGGRWSGF